MERESEEVREWDRERERKRDRKRRERRKRDAGVLVLPSFFFCFF